MKTFALLGENGLPVRIFKTMKEYANWLNDPERLKEWVGPNGWHIHEMDRRQAVQQIRLQVWQRADGECEDCGQSITVQAFHMHEGRHRGQGGEISLDNSHCLCYTCHFDIEHGNRKTRFHEKSIEVDIEHDVVPPGFTL